MHVDTGYKFTEMYEFRDRCVQEIGADLLVWRNEPAITAGANPFDLGTQNCCGFLKTEALLTGLRHHRFDAAIGGARRDEEKSRAKERFFSFRDQFGQWDPKNQRPELWNLYNARVNPGESIRVFPLSNWTELDVWQYIYLEQIPVNPLYFAKPREAVIRNGTDHRPRSRLRAGPALWAIGGRAGRADPLSVPQPRLRPLLRGHSLDGLEHRGDRRGDDGRPHLRARHARHRSRLRRVHGEKEARGVLLT
jgi:3'-phosphoadenosine 5'-phosphosulfate sulfotransferase (PAPS reductase)/FAD synthetase